MNKTLLIAGALFVGAGAIWLSQSITPPKSAETPATSAAKPSKTTPTPIQAAAPAKKSAPAKKTDLAIATFGSGCFWCTEADFDKVEGVVATISGYMGGKTENPTYRQVVSGTTGHAEVVQISYDPKQVTYKDLLKVYWRNVDPYVTNRQFCDAGSQYRPVIFVHNEQQKMQALESKKELEKSGKLTGPILVTIEPAATFNRAEEYHQDFYKKKPGHYYYYRRGCGRDARLRQIWGPKEK